MRLSLCNEVIREFEFARQCAFAAELGYAGLELAPFTLGEDAYAMSSERRAVLRRALSDAGIVVSGLHWLLVAPPGLSITSGDAGVRERTRDVLKGLVELCAELGGEYLVHGSPAQRRIGDAADPRAAALRAEETWDAIAEQARAANVIYCIEPLALPEADFINTLAEAAAIVQRIGNPALRTMIDTSAAFRMEPQPLSDVVAEWLPTGLVAHVQLNDRNRRGPGQGSDQFAPLLRALRDAGYHQWLGIEPFEYSPDGPGCAARSIGYVAGILESLDATR